MKNGIAIFAVALFGGGFCQLSAAQTAPAETIPVETPPAQTAPVPAAPAETPAAQTAPVRSNVIYLSQEASYSHPDVIDQAVLTECQLPQQQAELIEAAARRAGFHIVRDEQAVKARKGRVLQVEIVNALSSGNAFIGHRKQVVIRGKLFEDGKEIGEFQGRRSSMGGAFGGFKGSCSVLGRCLEALAGDITVWLKNPTVNARIGD